jgi:hypothetical protein
MTGALGGDIGLRPWPFALIAGRSRQVVNFVTLHQVENRAHGEG